MRFLWISKNFFFHSCILSNRKKFLLKFDNFSKPKTIFRFHTLKHRHMFNAHQFWSFPTLSIFFPSWWRSRKGKNYDIRMSCLKFHCPNNFNENIFPLPRVINFQVAKLKHSRQFHLFDFHQKRVLLIQDYDWWSDKF